MVKMTKRGCELKLEKLDQIVTTELKKMQETEEAIKVYVVQSKEQEKQLRDLHDKSNNKDDIKMVLIKCY